MSCDLYENGSHWDLSSVDSLAERIDLICNTIEHCDIDIVYFKNFCSFDNVVCDIDLMPSEQYEACYEVGIELEKPNTRKIFQGYIPEVPSDKLQSTLRSIADCKCMVYNNENHQVSLSEETKSLKKERENYHECI